MEISSISETKTNKLSSISSRESMEEVKTSFKDVLGNALKDVNKLQNDYKEGVKNQILGEELELHNLVIAGEKARLALELTLQIRNKAVEAYQEIMRMQV